MNKQKTATMFLSELSVVDHAHITKDGTVVGGSFNPSFKVSGNVDPIENVVVDFSTIKKNVKNFIDDDTIGFDHKLWVINGVSNITNLVVNGEEIAESSLKELTETEGNTLVTVNTPMCSFVVPLNAIKIIGYDRDIEKVGDYNVENAGIWMEEYLNERFGGEVTVECNNTEHVHTFNDKTTNPVSYFRYDHGLKNSTSFGCQNPGHGHLSFLQLESDAPVEKQLEVLNKITKYLDGVTFINGENVVSESSDCIEIKYTSSNRGEMMAKYKLNSDKYGAKYIVLETETTAEHLVDYVVEMFYNDLNEIGATGLYLSEGLSKGTYIEI